MKKKIQTCQIKSAAERRLPVCLWSANALELSWAQRWQGGAPQPPNRQAWGDTGFHSQGVIRSPAPSKSDASAFERPSHFPFLSQYGLFLLPPIKTVCVREKWWSAVGWLCPLKAKYRESAATKVREVNFTKEMVYGAINLGGEMDGTFQLREPGRRQEALALQAVEKRKWEVMWQGA